MRKISVRWLRKWHAGVVRECGTDDICVLIEAVKALRQKEHFKKVLAAVVEVTKSQSVHVDYYCPEHRYNPPPNSGFCLCPKCEVKS